MLRLTQKLQSRLGLVTAGAALAGGLFVGSAGVAAATPAQAITISPTSIDQSVQPGSVNTGSFQVINGGDTSYSFTVYATPYRVINEDYNPDFTTLPGAPNITKWFQFSNDGTTLAPHQTLTIDYTLKVPVGTPAGGYYGVAFAQTKSQPSSTTGVVVTDRVGEIFYLRVAGKVKNSGHLLNWQAGFLQEQPLTGTVRIEDNGGYNFPGTIHATVKNVFGHTVYSFVTTRQILPQTIRRIKIPWPSTPPIGVFKIGGTASFLGQTHQLPTRYVLVVSPFARIILVIVIVGTVLSIIYRRRQDKQDVKAVYRHR